MRNAATSLYACADNGGLNAIVVNRASASGWETFSFISQPGNTYAIQVIFYLPYCYFIMLLYSNVKLYRLPPMGTYSHFKPMVDSSPPLPTPALFPTQLYFM